MKKITLVPYEGNWSLATAQTLRDIVKFSSELGFSPLYVPARNSIFSSIQYYLRKIRTLTADVLLVPYPAIGNPIGTTKLRSLDNSFLRFISKNAGSLILYVYDLPIEQIWFTRPAKWQFLLDSLSFSLEAELFDFADKILVFNKEMAKKIKERASISRNKFVYYEILDMGVNFEPKNLDLRDKRSIIVAYVGNLSRERVHGFERHFKLLPSQMNLWLIGPNGEWLSEKFDNVHYFGSLPDINFYSTLSKADFGLIWYPYNLSSYFRFSSSSKFSSYIVAGLPVLVDSHTEWPATVAKKYEVGVTERCVERLLIRAKDIFEDKEQYAQLRKNAMSLSYKIRRGYFFKQALAKAMEKG